MSKCWYCNNELTSGDSPKHFGICNKCYDEMFKSSDTIISSFTNKISDLEAKLAEKDKEIEQLTEELDYKNFWNDFVDLYTGNKLKTQMLHENCKDKISFAVEQLELAQKYIQQYVNNFDDMNDCLYAIDNQIKELKGE